MTRPSAARNPSSAPFYRLAGCDKTRFMEAMAQRLGRDLITVAGHGDMTSADLVGRFLLKGVKRSGRTGR